jgi:hypothetical protein
MKHVGLLISLQQKRCEDSDNATLSRNVATKGDTFACDRYRDTLLCCWACFEMKMIGYSGSDRPRPPYFICGFGWWRLSIVIFISNHTSKEETVFLNCFIGQK